MRQSKQTKKGGFTMSSKVSKKTNSVDSVVLGMGSGSGDTQASFNACVDYMIETILNGFSGLFTNEMLGIEFPSLVSGSSQPRHIFQKMSLKGSKTWTIRIVQKAIKSGQVNSQGSIKYFAIMKSPDVKVGYKVLETTKKHFDKYSQLVSDLKDTKQVVELVPTPTTTLDDIFSL